MPDISIEKLDLGQLTAEAKQKLAHKLYPIHNHIFDGVSFEQFYSYVLDSSATRSWLYLFKNRGGSLVGYAAQHFFRVEAGGKRSTVIKFEAGLLPELQGQGFLARALAFEPCKHILLNPFSSTYLFGSFVHPHMYVLLDKLVDQIYPHVEREMPVATFALMQNLAAHFGLKTADTGRPLARHIGWISRMNPWEADRLQQTTKKSARLFLEHNPNFANGEGLLVLVPLSLSNLVLSLINKPVFAEALKSVLARGFRTILVWPKARIHAMTLLTWNNSNS